MRCGLELELREEQYWGWLYMVNLEIYQELYLLPLCLVLSFGKARIVEGDEWLEAFATLIEKYAGDQPEEAKYKEITGCTHSYIIAVDVEHITGKEAIEYVNAKK